MCHRWCECVLESGSSLEADLPAMAQWSGVINTRLDEASSFFPDDERLLALAELSSYQALETAQAALTRQVVVG